MVVCVKCLKGDLENMPEASGGTEGTSRENSLGEQRQSSPVMPVQEMRMRRDERVARRQRYTAEATGATVVQKVGREVRRWGG